MASIGFLLGRAIANALAFTGSSYLFHSLSKDSINKEQKRHNLEIEQLQKAQISWQKKRQELIDFINRQLMLEKKQKVNSQNLTMR